MKRALSLLFLLPLLTGSMKGFGMPQPPKPLALYTFVISTGNDANQCSRVSPCRTLGAAIAQTTPRGEVTILDSNAYNSLAGTDTITKSVKIVAAPGVHAALIATGSNDAVDINAGNNDEIVLRGLTLNSLEGKYGIHMYSSSHLLLENSVVDGFEDGIYVDNTAADLYLNGVTLHDNSYGIQATGPATGTNVSTITLNHSSIDDSFFYGIMAGPRTRFTIRDTVFAKNEIGIYAFPGENGTALTAPDVTITECMFTGNVSAIGASTVLTSNGFVNYDGLSVVRVGRTTISGNLHALVTNKHGSQILSFGDNHVAGNQDHEAFSGVLGSS